MDEISVVIPVFNREQLIIRCLDSVKAQTHRPIRVIVVDNGSTDGTVAAVSRWIETNASGDFRADLFTESKPGAAAARNRGLREVTTDRVMFFDSDDTMRPRLVETVARELTPDLDMIYWKTVEHRASGDFVRAFSTRNLLERQAYNAMLDTQGMAVKTEFLRRVGEWEERALVWNDWELGLRLLKNNPRIKGVAEILVDIYPQKVSITGETHAEKAGQWETTLDLVEAMAAGDRRLIRMVIYRRLNLAALYRREGREDLARPLLAGVLARKELGPLDRLKARLIYHFTSRGGRGAYLLWKA